MKKMKKKVMASMSSTTKASVQRRKAMCEDRNIEAMFMTSIWIKRTDLNMMHGLDNATNHPQIASI